MVVDYTTERMLRNFSFVFDRSLCPSFSDMVVIYDSISKHDNKFHEVTSVIISKLFNATKYGYSNKIDGSVAYCYALNKETGVFSIENAKFPELSYPRIRLSNQKEVPNISKSSHITERQNLSSFGILLYQANPKHAKIKNPSPKSKVSPMDIKDDKTIKEMLYSGKQFWENGVIHRIVARIPQPNGTGYFYYDFKNHYPNVFHGFKNSALGEHIKRQVDKHYEASMSN